MKRRLCLTLICVLLAGLCPAAAFAEAPVEISMFVTAPEYADAIRTLIDAYKLVKPNVTIRYEATQSDYPALLKTRINAGECPDIFATTSGKEIALYQDYTLDLSGTPAAGALLDSVRSVMSAGGGVYGFHYVCNDFGIVYNRAIFDDCGIAGFPQTLAQLEEACRTLEAAGYQPFTTGFGEWWVFKHIFQHFLNATGENPAELTARFALGEAKLKDYPALYDQFFKLIDLAVRYGDAQPLETDLSAEEKAMVSGKAAMMLGQGAWVEADLLSADPSFRIGFDGYPVSADPAQCQVISGPDQALRVYRDSAVLSDVLDFVNWWLTSDYGLAWTSDVCRVIPAVKGAKVPDTAIASQGAALMAQKGAGMLSVSFSSDSFHQLFGSILQSYVGGVISRDEACGRIEQAWVETDGAAP